MYALIMLEGWLTNDVTFSDGKYGEYATFSVSVPHRSAGSEGKSFFNCLVPAALCGRLKKSGLHSGSTLQVTGNLTLQSYRASDGQTRMGADVRVLDWNFPSGSSARKKSDSQDDSLDETIYIPF